MLKEAETVQKAKVMIDKSEELKRIWDEIIALTDSPLYPYRVENNYRPVIGEGSTDAAAMFIGEAPGASEAREGRPFIGASGRFLNELLESIGLQREDVYITNVVKDRPPENRSPHKKEIALYAPFLERQVKVIQPKVLVTLGRFALEFIAARYAPQLTSPKITLLHGTVIHGQAPYGDVQIVPLFHPAVALYDAQQRQTLFADFQTLKSLVNTDVTSEHP
jgi:uracil-DNA glycosylase